MQNRQLDHIRHGMIPRHLGEGTVDMNLLSPDIDTMVKMNTAEEPRTKRSPVIDWDHYFMGVALLSAKRSKDPRTQVGACIVNHQHVIVSTGYNGMPHGCSDDVMPWGRGQDMLTNKHSFVCCAEMNAIFNKNNADVHDCTLYVTLFPCVQCAKLVVQSGMKSVVYLFEKQNKEEQTKASKWMFKQAGVNYRWFQPSQSQIVLDFDGSNHVSMATAPAFKPHVCSRFFSYISGFFKND